MLFSMKNRAIMILVCICTPILGSCWYLKQGSAFLGEKASAVSMKTLAKKADSPPELLDFIELVDELRNFATERLGLNTKKNYTNYITVEKGYIADVVSACDADSFRRYQWRYPILGSLPYKGFYNKDDALKEVARLKAAGLDVVMREVDAFSSLGIFSDPVYSFMINYDEDVLAELIFHESTHATIFIKGAEQFNEELATFTGRMAAELWLEEKYGPGSAELKKRKDRQADRASFVNWLHETGLLLEEVYSTDASRDEKLEQKRAIITARAEEFRQLAPLLFINPAWADFDMSQINNAYIDLYRLYEEDLSLYERWFTQIADGSLSEFIRTIAVLAKEAGRKKNADLKEEMMQILQFF